MQKEMLPYLQKIISLEQAAYEEYRKELARYPELVQNKEASYQRALRYAEYLDQLIAQQEKKLADTKLIDRAKCMLIQYLGMTEDQAHRQIEKQAMDNRQTKTAIARGILANYEL